jgi:hypothetical protein
VDAVAFEKNDIRISGWGYFSSDEGRVLVDTDLPIRSMALLRELRPDVVSDTGDASLRKSGFQIRLTLQTKVETSRRYRACFWTEDPKFGRRELSDSPRIEAKALFECGVPTGSLP